ncbi:amidohydrolase [Alkalibacillus filiformis]|uniref:Amidohydrolase n=1 Tax=Alkalibacillus filiformis TaxID=200990 RepID=A0ABU0DXH5_9BACI|nr:amidohydrolase [Alkalibacillus filiformis]MDQ0353075.1 amidohydrolase [Alkalibacillus filiformis]
MEKFFSYLESINPELVEFRRDLHMYPEVSHEEVETPKKIAAYLENLGLEVRTGVGGRGVLGILHGGQLGKTVALRADFDALPIQDEKDVDFKSRVDGVMHACGHDVHTSALLGVATVLSQFKDEVPGTIVFVHQFGEEMTPGGAKPMIDDGCLDGVDMIYGAHVMSNLPVGQFGVRSGYISSAQDDFVIEVHGKGGHGAMPHMTVDALVTGSQLVTNLQQIVSRRVSPMDAAAVTVGSFHSGEGHNVIPEKAVLKGTVRTYSAEARDMIEQSLHNITKMTCEAAGAGYEIDYVRDCPSMYNDPLETERIRQLGVEVFGEDHTVEAEPLMGSEDFAYFQEEVPGVYFILGGGNPEVGAEYPHHHPMFNVDERAIENIAKMMLTAVIK